MKYIILAILFCSCASIQPRYAWDCQGEDQAVEDYYNECCNSTAKSHSNCLWEAKYLNCKRIDLR